MNYDYFLAGIEDIYAIFGKKRPSEQTIKMIYKRIVTCPENFIDFTINYFEDQDALPPNMGRFLIRELWPNFLDKHPELRAREYTHSCPKCVPDIPGYRKVWDPHGMSHIVRCSCGNAPNPDGDQILEDEDWLAMGWYFEDPNGPIPQDKIGRIKNKYKQGNISDLLKEF